MLHTHTHTRTYLSLCIYIYIHIQMRACNVCMYELYILRMKTQYMLFVVSCTGAPCHLSSSCSAPTTTLAFVHSHNFNQLELAFPFLCLASVDSSFSFHTPTRDTRLLLFFPITAFSCPSPQTQPANRPCVPQRVQGKPL